MSGVKANQGVVRREIIFWLMLRIYVGALKKIKSVLDHSWLETESCKDNCDNDVVREIMISPYLSFS
jgi:hypothetical protein